MRQIALRFLAVSLFLAGTHLFAADTLDLYFLDVELGNAVLVVPPSGEIMMLDAGPPGTKYVNRVLSALKSVGARQIDYLVISHYHWDHFGNVVDLIQKIPIKNIVDHGFNIEVGRSEQWRRHWFRMENIRWDQEHLGAKEPRREAFDAYEKARGKSHHIQAYPGEKVPIRGVDTLILTAGGYQISCPLPGAGKPNAACDHTEFRGDDETEDGQSVGVLLSFGKFRFIDLGDLTWNRERKLFCPNNPIGNVDLYLMTHHAMTQKKELIGEVDWSRSSMPPAEVHGLRPRVSILSAGYHYVMELATPEGWQLVKKSPGMEDLWQTTYQVQGGAANNSPENLIANLDEKNDQGHYIKVSAYQDGSFTVTNSRNGFTKKYPARK